MLLICVILKICCWPQSTGKLFEFSAYIISKILHIKRFWFSWKIVIFRLTVFWLWKGEGLALKLARMATRARSDLDTRSTACSSLSSISQEWSTDQWLWGNSLPLPFRSLSPPFPPLFFGILVHFRHKCALFWLLSDEISRVYCPLKERFRDIPAVFEIHCRGRKKDLDYTT